MTTLDLSFLNDGKSLSLSLGQLQAMDKELSDIANKAPEIIALASAFGLTYTQASKLTKELQLAPQQLQSAVGTMSQLKSVGADGVTQYAVLGKQLGLSAEQMRLLADEVELLGGKKDAVADLQGALAQLFILDKVNQFKAAVLDTGKVFEGLNTRLKTTLGGQLAADSALASIQEFAATTPFELVEVTDAFVKLKQRGIQPTDEALRSLGDIASSQGKSLNQTTEALLDASQGEFERLKEFGIKASAAGDKVNISFQGVNKQVERTPEAITAGILAVGKLDGVAGGMAEQAKTLGGSLSNLKDSQDKLANSAFMLVQPYAVGLVQAFTGLINGFSELDPAFQKAVLLTATLGAAVASAVVGLAAFQAANIATALSTAATSLVTGAQSIATGALAVAAFAASQAENSLVLSMIAGTGASTANTGSIVTNTVAKLANAKASTVAAASSAKAGIAAKIAAAGGGKALIATAASTALVAGLAVAAAASIGVAVDSYFKQTEAQRDAKKTSDDLAKSFAALDEATAKREASAKAQANAEAAGAEKTRRAGLSLAELAKANEADDAKYKKAFEERTEGRINIVQRVLDKVTEFINLPAEGFKRTFELLVKLPAPKFVKDFFGNIAERFEAMKLQLNRDSIKGDDIIAFNSLLTDSSKLSAKLSELKQKTKGIGGIGNASKGEVEALSKSYGDMIKKLQDVTPANAQAAQERDAEIRSLAKQKEEVDQSAKAIEERAKRITSAGPADTQWAAEVKKVTTNITKQIATSEDAQKQIDITKKQLENGFIDEGQAKAQFEQVAKYTSASGDIQVAAAKELRELRKKDTDKQKAILEVESTLAEVKGAQQIQSAEETSAQVAAVKVKQAEVEIASIRAVLNEEAAAGRTTGEIYKKAQTDLNKALADKELSQANALNASRKAAEAEVTKSLKESADARAEAETDSATESKEGVLKAIKSGNLTIDEAEKEGEEKRAVKSKAALKEEIALKKQKQQELLAIGGKEAIEKAGELGREVGKLQEKQVDNEIARVKRAQQKILDAIRDAIDKRKALLAIDTGKAEEASSAKELQLIKGKEASKADIAELGARRKLEIQKRSLTAETKIASDQISQIRAAAQAGKINKKDADKQLLQLEADLSSKRNGLIQNQIELVKQAEEAKLRVLQEAQDKRRALADREIAAKDETASADNLARVKANVLSQTEVEEAAAADRRAIRKAEADNSAKLLQQELADARDVVAKGVLNKKDSAKQILKLETDLSKARANAANVEAEAILAERAKMQRAITEQIRLESEASANIQQAYAASVEQSIADIRLESAGITGDKLEAIDKAIALKRQSLALESAKAALESAEREAIGLDLQAQAGLISAKDLANKKSAVAAKALQAQAQLTAAQADYEVLKAKQVLEAKLKGFDTELKVRQLVANKAIGLIQSEQEAIGKRQALLSAEDRLESARAKSREISKSLAVQELQIALDLANANGDTASADRLGIQIKQLELASLQAQSAEIDKQYESKRAALELDIRSKELANEQLVIEKELAALEAQQAVKSAQLQGKSKEEVDLLRQKAELSAKALDSAKAGTANIAELSKLQRAALELEKANDKNANSGQVRKAQADINLAEVQKQSKANQGGGGQGKQGGGNGFSPELTKETTTKGGPQTTTLTANLAQPLEGAGTAATVLSESFADASKAVGSFTAATNQAATGQGQGQIQQPNNLVPLPRQVGARADGGPVLPGGAYLVGERGPELVTFGSQGLVLSHEKTQAALAELSKGLNVKAAQAAPTSSNADLLQQLTKLNKAVANRPKTEAMNVPVNVYATGADGAAQALQLIRAERAQRYSSPL